MTEAEYAAYMLEEQEALATALRKRLAQAQAHQWQDKAMKASAIEGYTGRLRKAEAFAEHWRKTLAVLQGAA